MTNYVKREGVEYSFAFARDITGGNEIEDALRESEERYRRLLAQSFDAVILHQDGKIVFANDAAARLVKARGPEEMVGRSALDFVDPQFSGIVSGPDPKQCVFPGSCRPACRGAIPLLRRHNGRRGGDRDQCHVRGKTGRPGRRPRYLRAQADRRRPCGRQTGSSIS